MNRTPEQKAALRHDAIELGKMAYNTGQSMDDNPYHFYKDYSKWADWNDGYLHRLLMEDSHS